MILSVCSAGQEESTRREIHLRATVKAVSPLASFSGTIIPVDFDSRFALTVRIESAAPANDNFTKGAVVTFAIHSPTLLFYGQRANSKTYAFSLHRTIENGKTTFGGLAVSSARRDPFKTGP
jgi:hypothetical protein